MSDIKFTLVDYEALFRGHGIYVDFENPDDFLKIRETLTRIGVASRTEKTLWQSCHILHKRDRDTQNSRYAIVHFKELFALDGYNSNIPESDIARRNTIALLLEEWGLLNILTPKSEIEGIQCPLNQIKILPFREKDEWKLCPKYTIGG